MKKTYFTICLIVIILLSGIRSGPVFGKLDFILLESRPWWSEWKPMIQKITNDNKKPIYTDALTGNVLNAIFNQPISNEYQWNFQGSQLNIKSLDTLKINNKYQCVINLHGFSPSWVPKETGHWNDQSSDTSIYYHYNGIRGEALINFLKENKLKYCDVYF